MIEQLFSSSEAIARLRAGPLGESTDAFAEQLSAQGYPPSTLRQKIRWVGRLNHWLDDRQTDVAGLDEDRVVEFLAWHSAERSSQKPDAVTFRQLLCSLRSAGLVPEAPAKGGGPLPHPVLDEFTRYLAEERGLGAAAQRYQVLIAKRFLDERFGTRPIDCRLLSAEDVSAFTLRHTPSYTLRTAQTMLSALRGFLRFLVQRGHTATDLTGCVFRVAVWRLSGLPKFLKPDEVEQLLVSIDRTTSTGLRDYAILLLLARLGLRGGEVVELKLEDLDWDAGTITVRGKSSRHNKLPLPWDIGEAIVQYLRVGRPQCSSRHVFLRAIAPHGRLQSSSAITSLVKHHLQRAGLNPAKRGAHVLRHSLATRMIRGGNTLAEIGDILGHQFHSSTEIYAKVALNALRELAQPWPGARS